MTRDEIDSRVDKMFDTGHNLLLTWATGCGKSRQAIRWINRLDNPKTLICVAEIAHINNWAKEFTKWSMSGMFKSVKVICYASLAKYKGTEWDLIVLDECHHIATDIRVDALSDIKAKNVISLSATVTDATRGALETIFGRLDEFRIGMKDAIAWNILPEPKIILVPLHLDCTKADQTFVIKWGKAALRKRVTCTMPERWEYLKNKKKYPDMELYVKCSEAQKYSLISERFEYNKKRYMATRNDAVKNMWMQAGSERKRFLGESKTRHAERIINSRLKGYRHIVFCTDIIQADVLGGKNAIHSQAAWPQTKIAEFNVGKTDSIYAVGMLQEGMNLYNIEKGMIIQLDGAERAFVQKLGRLLRAEEPEIYILYFEGTRDQEYLNKALEGIDKKYITTMKL